MSELRNYDDLTKEIKEIINGKIYYMSRGTAMHVKSIVRIGYKFNKYFDLKNLQCEAYTSDLDVYLDQENEKNYVEPDISIICDDSKFFKKGYKGVPKLIVEVISPKTRKIDRGIKLKLYEKSGVEEYWIVEPKIKSIEQYVLEDGAYELKNIVAIMDEDEMTEEEKVNYTTVIKTSIYNDLEIDLNDIFLKTDIID